MCAGRKSLSGSIILSLRSLQTCQLQTFPVAVSCQINGGPISLGRELPPLRNG